ncbi:MAG: glycosyltransferase family 4 protein [Aridibacter famidurans]|nr:glycosyltransferase family 4 protein [Aridibacter famidurans]
MRILHLMSQLERGGAEMLALDVCANAVDAGLDITLCSFYGGTMEPEFRDTGVEMLIPFSENQRVWTLVRELRKTIKSGRFSIVHANQPREALVSVLAAFATGTKTVFTYHGFKPGRRDTQCVNASSRFCAANVFCSKFMLDYYQQLPELRTIPNTHVIYNGIDRRRLVSSGNSIRSELGIPSDVTVGVMVSTFRPPVKDQKTVCLALKKLAENGNEIQFIFAGSPYSADARSCFEECRTIVRDSGLDESVHFVGSRQDIPDILDSADFVVHSSLHEGHPLAVIEAMMKRKPIILSDIPAHRETSEDGTTCLLFKTGDPESLAERLIELLESPRLQEEIADRGFEIAERRYTIERHLESLSSLYSSLV